MLFWGRTLSCSVNVQEGVLHSSADSEIVSMGAETRMDGLPAPQFWECVLENVTDSSARIDPEHQQTEARGTFDVAFVAANITDSSHLTKLFSFQGSAAVT